MPTDPSLAILFLVFLALFVLTGSSPVLHRLFGLTGVLFSGLKRLRGGIDAHSEAKPGHEKPWRENALNDYEIILLRKLAMTGGKGLSRKSLINTLYLKPASVDRALTGLSANRLVRPARRSLFGTYFSLTSEGQDHAFKLDLVPRYQLQSRGKGNSSLIR
mgnify:CR=1 FL=1